MDQREDHRKDEGQADSTEGADDDRQGLWWVVEWWSEEQCLADTLRGNLHFDQE